MCDMIFCLLPKNMCGISWKISGISAGVVSLWPSPRKSWSQSLKKTKTICLKEQRANILIKFKTLVNLSDSLFLF